MPPHRLPAQPLPDPTQNSLQHALWRATKLLILASSLALAGCAANRHTAQTADAIDLHLRTERDNYLQQTKSDPLGAYLSEAQTQNFYSQNLDTQTSYTPSTSRRFKGDQGMANVALDFLGIKYRFGGDTPKTGFDCSGLVAYAAEKSLGLKLPHHAAALARRGEPVKRKDLKKGDLVFFNTRGARYSHVGIYLGHDRFVHAPRTGTRVRIEDMDQSYWKKRYTGARRLAANGPMHTSGK